LFFDFFVALESSSIEFVPALLRLRDLSLPLFSLSPVGSSPKSALKVLPLAVVAVFFEVLYKASRSFIATFWYSEGLDFSGSFACSLYSTE
jgi:hypothetical protein